MSTPTPVTTPKLVDLQPTWARFTGWSVLATDPPAVPLYGLLAGWAGSIRDALAASSDDAPLAWLPPSTFHLTVLDGLNQSHVRRLRPAQGAAVAAALAALPDEVDDPVLRAGVDLGPLLEVVGRSPCALRVAGVHVGGHAVMARLEPADTDAAAQLDRIRAARTAVLADLSRAAGLDLITPWVPHVTLAYVANREAAAALSSRIEQVAAATRPEGTDTAVLTVTGAALHTFTSMVDFRPAPPATWPSDPAPDDRGLADIRQVLEAHGVAYWIDSGILLGLRRGGELLRWEKDIDLGVEGSQATALLACLPALAAIGYEVDVNRYRGVLWSVGMQPLAPRAATDLRAAVHVFHRIGDQLWSPQPQIYVPPPAPDVRRRRRTPVGRALRWGIDRWLYSRGEVAADEARVSRAPDQPGPAARAARWVYRHVDGGVLAELWPISEIYVPLTWVYPADLVLPLGELSVGATTVPVPHDVDGYLGYRYGDWRTPVGNWCYWEDDGAIRHDNPVDVAKALREAARTVR